MPLNMDAVLAHAEYHDVSPDFVYSKVDAEIIARILPLEATPKAIRAFSNSHRALSDYAYWFMLGTLWVSYTGYSDLVLWKRLLSSDRPKRETSLMKPSELAMFRILPEELTVYRAHRPGEIDWIAYTLDPEKAATFAMKRGVDKVHEYIVPKQHALCLFLRRGESEVLVLDKSNARLNRVLNVEIAHTTT